MLLKVCESESLLGGMWVVGDCAVLEEPLSIANGISFVERSCLMPDLKPGSRNVLASQKSPLCSKVRAAAASCKRLGEEWRLVGES